MASQSPHSDWQLRTADLIALKTNGLTAKPIGLQLPHFGN
jgi:hypothetical protein